MKPKNIILLTLTANLLSTPAFSCEFCSPDLPVLSLDGRSGWHAGVSEEYTSSGTLNMDGHAIRNVAGQYLHSSVTQIYFGYKFGQSLGVQMNIPMIYRTYQRVEAGALQNGAVSGIGDLSFLAHWTPVRMERESFRMSGRVFAGFSIPTGDNHQVREEAAEGGHDDGEEHGEGGHEEEEGHGEEEGHMDVPNGVHGHDLALGTGSVNGLFGADIHLQWKRAVLDAGVVAQICGHGRNDYDFANTLEWNASIGAVILDKKDFALTCALAFSGSTKGEDTFMGVESDDTASTIVYIGPKVSATWRQRLHVDVGVGFPIANRNSGVQVVPDFQFQASVGMRF